MRTRPREGGERSGLVREMAASTLSRGRLLLLMIRRLGRLLPQGLAGEDHHPGGGHVAFCLGRRAFEGQLPRGRTAIQSRGHHLGYRFPGGHLGLRVDDHDLLLEVVFIKVQGHPFDIFDGFLVHPLRLAAAVPDFPDLELHRLHVLRLRRRRRLAGVRSGFSVRFGLHLLGDEVLIRLGKKRQGRLDGLAVGQLDFDVGSVGTDQLPFQGFGGVIGRGPLAGLESAHEQHDAQRAGDESSESFHGKSL